MSTPGIPRLEADNPAVYWKDRGPRPQPDPATTGARSRQDRFWLVSTPVETAATVFLTFGVMPPGRI